MNNNAAAQKSKATLYIVAVLFLCGLDAAFVIAISIVSPARDNMPLILTILGVTSPVVLALMAAALQQVNLAVDGRLTQLLELTAKSRFAEGQLQGLMTPVPGSDVAQAVIAVTKDAQLEAARLAGKEEGIESERSREEQKP